MIDDEPAAPLLGEPPAVELMNTVRADRDGVHDTLATPEQALAWLRIIRDRLAPQPAAVDAWLDAARPGDAAAVTRRLRVLRDGGSQDVVHDTRLHDREPFPRIDLEDPAHPLG